MTDRVPGPDRQLLPGLAEQLLSSALDITEALLDRVVEPGLLGADPPDFTKEIAEVAMLLRLAGRSGAADPDRVAALAGRIAPLARAEQVLDRLVSRPSRAVPHLLAHGCLQQLGRTDDRFHELALSVLGAGAAQAEERVPYRLLDSGWIRHLLLGDAELAHPALAVSPVARGVDLIATTIEDAYAFSHALPYATDFGRVELPDWANVHWLSGIADALILKALDEDDLDLLGELLLAPTLLRLEFSSVQWFGWQVLIDTWQHYGFLPGPGLPPAEPDESEAAADRRVLGTVYHTSLVGGLLIATVACYGRWPDATPPAQDRQVFLGVKGTDRAWQRCWHRLPARHRSELAAVPAGIALHQAAAATDVLRLVDCLSAPSLDLLPAPLVDQAVELLNRLALWVGLPEQPASV